MFYVFYANLSFFGRNKDFKDMLSNLHDYVFYEELAKPKMSLKINVFFLTLPRKASSLRGS